MVLSWSNGIDDMRSREVSWTNMTRRVVAFVFLCLAATGFSEKRDDVIEGYQPREGDIIFQSLASGALAEAIEGTTQSSYSHCGIVTSRRRMDGS
jgi:hypothetical protein